MPPEAQLARALPGIQAVYLFPFREVPRSAPDKPLLGFAGLELVRRAETGRPLLPDAFPRDDRWFLQIATAVRNPVSQAVMGSLLVVFDTQELQALLTVTDADLGGRLALIQTVAGTSRTVASQGAGSGPSLSRTLMNPDWSVQYTPARLPEPPVSLTWLALLVGLPALVAAILVWGLLGNAQRSLRADVSALIQWAHKVFAGDKARLPGAHWDLVGSLGEVLFRIAQMVEKRVAKASESARPKPASGPASEVVEEPLFQNTDMPDIDMLDGDEDVLGFGGDAPLAGDEALVVEEVAAPAVELAPEIFRAYDIRGIVGETLSAEGVEVIGRAIGSEALARGVSSLCVGYDGRHSSPELADALARGVMAAGCDVIHGRRRADAGAVLRHLPAGDRLRGDGDRQSQSGQLQRPEDHARGGDAVRRRHSGPVPACPERRSGPWPGPPVEPGCASGLSGSDRWGHRRGGSAESGGGCR